MKHLKAITLAGLLGVGAVYGADPLPKPVVDYVNDNGGNNIGENGRNELKMAVELWGLDATKPINKKEFNELLKKYFDLMIVGRMTKPDWLCQEIRMQTAFFRRAYDLWSNDPELRDKNTTKLLKELSVSIYTLNKEHQIPNYTPRPYSKLNVAIMGGEPTQGWKDFVAKNDENWRENSVQKTIQQSLETMDAFTPAIDKAIADESASR